MNKPFLLLFVVALLIQTGCTPEPEIVRHRIPKDRSGLEKLRLPSTPVANTAPQQKTRMAVAIFENPDATWFFKISGQANRVDKSESQWMDFLQTVKFENKEPKWDAPADWSMAGAKPMRHSTLVIDKAIPPLELAISSLGPDQDLLLNINRWRRQIGLQPSSESELDDQIEKLENENGKFLLFNAVGVGSGQMTPPFARGGGQAPFAGNAQAPFAQGSSAPRKSEKIDFEPIEGWTSGKTSSMVPIRLSKTVGEAQVQITVIEMPADVNEWDPNVKRWAQQVQLGSLSKEEFAKRTSKFEVDGVEGQIIDLIDPDSESLEGTIAGMVKRDGSAWFLKLTGDKGLTQEYRGEFEEFLGSLKFK